jgi:hypothetical protein
MARSFLLGMALLLLGLNFTKTDLNASSYATPGYDHKEKFDPSLSSIRSINALIQYIDSLAAIQSLSPQSPEYVILTEKVISNRFYHGFSHLNFRENWVAAVAEKVAGHGLSCKVYPEDIMQHDNAACSQQCMVMMEVLKQKNIPYRSVGFPHHYALEASINNEWYFFDPNMEPTITTEQRKEQYWGSNADILKKHYDASRFTDLDYKFGNNLPAVMGTLNEIPAQNAKLFQSATSVFSKTAFLFPIVLLLFVKKRVRSKSNPLVQKTGFSFTQWVKNYFIPRPVGAA